MKQNKWPLIIGSMLTLHVLACLFFVYLATSNQSFAVEEDYYQKALQWDASRARDAASERLGWRLEISISGPLQPGVPAALECVLSDGYGQPVKGAAVTAEAFPIARADQIQRCTLRESGAGRYLSELPVIRSGRWELRLSATRGNEHYQRSMQIFVDPEVGARGQG